MMLRSTLIVLGLSATLALGADKKKAGDAEKGKQLSRPCKVGSYKPNAWGLYDMHGNVWQWTADWSDKEYYKESPKEDPQGPEKGKFRVLRGGSWGNVGWNCRAAYRGNVDPAGRDYNFGFRVVLVAPRTP